jgi:hypothetical protein
LNVFVLVRSRVRCRMAREDRFRMEPLAKSRSGPNPLSKFQSVDQQNRQGCKRQLSPAAQTRPCKLRAASCQLRKSGRVRIGERSAHGVDRNSRYETREEEPGHTNPNRKCARERLPRYDIPITNRETGDEGERKAGLE